jgi:ubiquinone/menaquinone biosynthesis C-methylase UbiE
MVNDRGMNYNDFASVYAETRRALPWVLSSLASAVSGLPNESIIVEIGCGTGDYIIALSEKCPSDHEFFGFDLSPEMLKIAGERGKERVEFRSGNANDRFPFPDDFANMLFCMNVVHHLADLERFFEESYRVLKDGGILVIVTESEEDIETCGMIKYFPEAKEIGLKRFPAIDSLTDEANQTGFREFVSGKTSGYVLIDQRFIDRLARKCYSTFWLMTDDAHRRGMQRLEKARSKGEKWFSTFTVLRFEK